MSNTSKVKLTDAVLQDMFQQLCEGATYVQLAKDSGWSDGTIKRRIREHCLVTGQLAKLSNLFRKDTKVIGTKVVSVTKRMNPVAMYNPVRPTAPLHKFNSQQTAVNWCKRRGINLTMYKLKKALKNPNYLAEGYLWKFI